MSHFRKLFKTLFFNRRFQNKKEDLLNIFIKILAEIFLQDSLVQLFAFFK
jgi:hypothetical protein